MSYIKNHINYYLNNIKEWWNPLALREKQMVSAGALLISLLLFYLILWSPLSNAVDTLRSQIQKNQDLLVWMQDADKHIQALNKTAQPTKLSRSPGSLLSVIQKNINQTPLAKQLSQLHQAENDSVQLTFQKVVFDDLIRWLIQITLQQGLTITQMTVTPSATSGVVAVDLILKAQ